MNKTMYIVNIGLLIFLSTWVSNCLKRYHTEESPNRLSQVPFDNGMSFSCFMENKSAQNRTPLIRNSMAEFECPQVKAESGLAWTWNIQNKTPYYYSIFGPNILPQTHRLDYDFEALARNEHVQRWIRYYTGGGGKRTLEIWLSNLIYYQETIEQILAKNNLPKELIYVALVESGFKRKAVSHRFAVGPWQFTKPTAKRFGLTIDFWRDDRKSIIHSTQAASQYLTHLFDYYKDWSLALAAYNAGPSKVNRAVRKSGTKNIWELIDKKALNRETRNYIPKIVAAIIIGRDPQRYGLKVDTPVETFERQFALLRLERPLLLSEIASSTGAKIHQVKKWNPEIRRHITPPPRDANHFHLKLPLTLKAKFLASLNTLSPVKISDIKMYKIRQGDTISDIAKRFGIRQKEILRYNPAIKPHRIRAGKQLAIPVPDAIALNKTTPSAHH